MSTGMSAYIRRHIMRWHSILLSLAGLCALLNGHVAHSSEELSTALQSGHAYGFGKVMYVADDKKGGRLNQSTPGFGGKIGAETGDYYGFSLKGAWYTTRDFGLRSANPKETDAYMFDVDKTPYSLLGEAQQFIVRAAGPQEHGESAGQLQRADLRGGFCIVSCHALS